jgi:hypothetical protein
MRIEVREANASTPERPLWLWNVFLGNLQVDRGFSSSEKEARQQAQLAVSRASHSY